MGTPHVHRDLQPLNSQLQSGECFVSVWACSLLRSRSAVPRCLVG